MRFSTVAILALAWLTLPATDPAGAQTPPALRVEGNKLMDANNRVVRLFGVNLPADSPCVANIGAAKRGYGVFDWKDQAGVDLTKIVQGLQKWKINAVRIPLNESCWNGNYPQVNTAYAGENYQNQIKDMVARLNAAGMYVILDLHWVGPRNLDTLQNVLAEGPWTMADADFSGDFWFDVATDFKNNLAVIFNLFNEPILNNKNNLGDVWKGDFWSVSDSMWQCWRDGCEIPADLPGAGGVRYKATGMQTMLSKVRAAGATQPVMFGGPSFTQDSTKWFQYVPTDETPAGYVGTWKSQIIFDYHRYSGCVEPKVVGDPTCEDQANSNFNQVYQYALPWLQKVAKVHPVLVGEFGQYDCRTGFVTQFMDAADANGFSYLGWNWNWKRDAALNCYGADGPFLLDGAPNELTNTPLENANPSAYGAGLKNHLAALAATPMTSLDPTLPSKFGQTVTFTATVTTPVAATPTGSVTFKEGATTLGTVPLSGGMATFQTFALAAGSHTITARYSGDGTFGTSTSPAITHQVAQRPTTTAAASSANPSVFGQSVTFSAFLSGTTPTSPTPTGLVTFMDGVVELGTATLSNGTATLQTSALSVGSHAIIANYGGNPNYIPSTSPAITQVVNKGATTMTASATPAKVAPGAPVTLKAQINVTSPATAAPSGQVTFKDRGATIGVGTIASGIAQLTFNPIPIGTHTITASYPGDSHVTGSSANSSFSVDASVGPESRVNTSTAGSQQLPAVAALTSGYVVAWASNGQDGSGFGVYAQRYTAAGAKAGVEFPVNTTKTGDQTLPTVAGLSDGSFVVIWQSNGEDTSGLGIYGQRFTAAGAKSGTEFRVNTTTANDQSLPSVAALTAGRFVVAWTSNGQDGSGLGVYAQIYAAGGVASGSEFRVNTTKTGDQSAPSIAGLTGGGFVIAWQSSGQDGSGLGVYAQRYDATGKTQTSEFRANTVAVNDQSLPSVSPLHNGGFIIAWQSALQDSSGLGVYSQRYTAAGARAGSETRVNTTTVDDQGTPRVASFSDGGYVIVWASNKQDGSGKGVYAQAFNDAGVRVNEEFKVNTTTANDQYQPAAAAFASGNFVAVWTSQSSDGSLENVFAQRFLLPGTH